MEETNRALEFRKRRLPLDLTMDNYARISANSFTMPTEHDYTTLINVTENLLDKYDLQIREMFLHGFYEPALRRQERLQALSAMMAR